MPAAAPPAPAASTPDETVTLVVNGQKFRGWQDIRVVRGMEVFPSHFVLRLTERFPDNPNLLAISPGAVARLFVGADLLMTAYVDTYEAEVSNKSHEVIVVGRSCTEDLVDCAAGVTSGQELQARMTFSAPTLLQLAQDLCAPLGIPVTEPDGEGTPLVSIADGIPQFTIALNQSVYDVLEPIARWKQMIIMDGPNGGLILAKLGKIKAGSGFSMPGAVQKASVGFRMQDRYSIYLPAMFNVDRAFDVSAAAHAGSANYFAPVRDDAAFKGQLRPDGKPRYRPHFVVSSQTMHDVNLAEQLAQWELARRWGRSQAVTATISHWRDRAGTLWAPNTLAPINIPSLKLQKLNWVISQVAYLKGFGGGTRAVVTLMPQKAFLPQPSFNTPFDPQIAQAQAQALGTRTPGSAAPAPTSPTDRASPNFNPNFGARPGGI